MLCESELYLPVLDHLPDKAERELGIALDDVVGVYVGDAHAVVPQRLQHDVHVAHVVDLHAAHLLLQLRARQDLEQLEQRRAVAQVHEQVAHRLALYLRQLRVDPLGECFLLHVLPLIYASKKQQRLLMRKGSSW